MTSNVLHMKLGESHKSGFPSSPRINEHWMHLYILKLLYQLTKTYSTVFPKFLIIIVKLRIKRTKLGGFWKALLINEQQTKRHSTLSVNL